MCNFRLFQLFTSLIFFHFTLKNIIVLAQLEKPIKNWVFAFAYRVRQKVHSNVTIVIMQHVWINVGIITIGSWHLMTVDISIFYPKNLLLMLSYYFSRFEVSYIKSRTSKCHANVSYFFTFFLSLHLQTQRNTRVKNCFSCKFVFPQTLSTCWMETCCGEFIFLSHLTFRLKALAEFAQWMFENVHSLSPQAKQTPEIISRWLWWKKNRRRRRYFQFTLNVQNIKNPIWAFLCFLAVFLIVKLKFLLFSLSKLRHLYYT